MVIGSPIIGVKRSGRETHDSSPVVWMIGVSRHTPLLPNYAIISAQKRFSLLSEARKSWIYFFRVVWPCITNVGWRERKQQDATNLIFIIKHLSQHVSGIIMPIIRRTRVCTAEYGVLHWMWWLWLCGAGTRAVCTFTVNTARVPVFRVMGAVFWDMMLNDLMELLGSFVKV